MFGPNRKFLYAVAVLVGSMVGVGIFGMPYAFEQAGFWPSMGLLVFVGFITLLVDMMYGEVVLRTHAKHQLFGYSKLYLKPFFQKLLFFSTVLLGYVALLAYIVISGDFLNTLLSNFFFAPIVAYSLLFTIVVSIAVLNGIKTVSRVELFFCTLFVLVMALISVTGFHAIKPEHFVGFSRANFGLPYGVLLFAFGGLVGIPIQREILAGKEVLLRKAIAMAVVISGILYAVFSTVVVGVSGSQTTTDAVSGLFSFLGSKVTLLSSLFGIFAITTSFLIVASGMIGTLHFDFKIKKFNAWILTIFPPVILFLAGIRTFIGIISLAGGVALGLEQIMIVFLYEKAKIKGDRLPEYSLNIPSWLLYILITIFSIGIIYFLFIQ
jgi:tyrosine-specific transport protein